MFVQEKYDEEFARKVYALPLLSLSEVLTHKRPEENQVRVQYADKDGFRKMAKALGIMEDLKVKLLMITVGIEGRMLRWWRMKWPNALHSQHQSFSKEIDLLLIIYIHVHFFSVYLYISLQNMHIIV